MTQGGKVLLDCPTPDEKRCNGSISSSTCSNMDVPEMRNDPIDFVIQNIPHIW